MSTITRICGQIVYFSDDSQLQVPMEMTAIKHDTEIVLILDATTTSFKYDLDVSKKKFILGVNCLMIQSWQRRGRKPWDKPILMSEEST